jgi:transposase
MRYAVRLSAAEEWTLQHLSINHRHQDTHWRHTVFAAPNFADNCFVQTTSGSTVKGPDIAGFLDALIRQTDERPAMAVRDNESIDQSTLGRSFVHHKAPLFYLRRYSPGLSLIEIVWKNFKYHWWRSDTWTRETINVELATLLNGYRPKFRINFPGAIITTNLVISDR